LIGVGTLTLGPGPWVKGSGRSAKDAS
jgi:hypothetical protein